MNRCLTHGLRCTLILVLTAVAAWAQATAQMSGTVRDESGAVLPGVTVTVTQTNTAVVRTAVTDESGAYVLPNLPTGPYRLEASRSRESHRRRPLAPDRIREHARPVDFEQDGRMPQPGRAQFVAESSGHRVAQRPAVDEQLARTHHRLP